MGVLTIGALLFGVYIGASDFWKLTSNPSLFSEQKGPEVQVLRATTRETPETMICSLCAYTTAVGTLTLVIAVATLHRTQRMGGYQNHGPLLGSLNMRCRIILWTQKGP